MQTYEYFKSVFAPFQRTNPPPKYTADIPFQGKKNVVYGANTAYNYTVPSGQHLEILIISPFMYGSGIQDAGVSNIMISLAAVNPTATDELVSRYSMAYDGLAVQDPSTVPKYLNRASVQISATVPVTYEACMFVKTIALVPENADDMFNIHQKYSGTIPNNNQLWVNIIPTSFKKQVWARFDPGSHRPGVCVHYLIRVTNPNAFNANVKVGEVVSNVILEREGIEQSDPDLSVKSSPLGFTNYVLERLRMKHSFILINTLDADSIAAKTLEIEMDVKESIKSLAQDWYDVLSSVHGIDLKVLINFIIFYLE